MKKKIVLLFCSLCFLALFLNSCSTKTGDPFDQAGFNPLDQNLNKIVEAYFDASQPQAGNPPAGDPKVYIDFSNGLIQAYKDDNDNSAMLEKITQKLTGSEIKWFGMGKGEIYPLDYTTTEIFNKVTDPKSYSTEIMSPIEGAIKEITSANSDALLVTDFEEYTIDGKEQFENFAKGYSINWLSKGNSIDVLITNYNEKTKDGRQVLKHLYFIVFNYGKERKLLSEINYALQGRGYKYSTFSLSTDFYILSNEYGSEKKGGNYYDSEGNDNLCVLDANQYVNGLKRYHKNFEFYAFQQPWEAIFKDSKSFMEPGVPAPFTDFFRKLYLDASRDDVFQLNGLEVKVSDVTDDFLFFAKTQEAKNHKPILAKDSNGNSVFAETEKDPIALYCYDTDGKLLDAWTYKPIATTPLNEVFELNSVLYNNGYKDSKNKIEIGTKYNSNFDGSQITNPGGLLRVDIVISDCNPNFNKLSELFSWESTTIKGKTNEALSEAIRNTLDKVNPKGKVIYSYFIKTADQ
jgi:hypothetical protein